MDSTCVFSVGGIAFALQGQVPVQIQGPYLPFVEVETAPDVVIRVFVGTMPEPVTRKGDSLLYDTGDSWSLHRWRDGYQISVPSVSSKGAAYCQALISHDLMSVELYVAHQLLSGTVAGDAALRLGSLMYPLAELLLIWLLARQDGMLVHAAGVVDGESGYLFAGNSGHGKTTMARLWPEGTTILNDDRIVLRPRDGGLWMYGTPWHGEYQQVSSESFPISKIFFLSQSDSNYARPKPTSRAATLLLTRSFLPLWDRAAMSNLLSLCETVASTVRCYDLGFRPELSIIDLVRGLQEA